MTFEEAYGAFFNEIVSFCESNSDLDRYFAETAASKAFDVLQNKWDELNSHEKPVILAFLFKTAQFTKKEVLKQVPPEHLSIDDHETQMLIEKYCAENHYGIDFDHENKKYPHLVKKLGSIIKKELSADDYRLFRYLVVKKLTQKQTAKKMGISENAVKQRYARFKNRVKPILTKLLNVNDL